jgi:hypothetical protein
MQVTNLLNWPRLKMCNYGGNLSSNLSESFSLKGSRFGAKGEMEITAVTVNLCLTRG